MGLVALVLAFSSFAFAADKDRVDKVSNKDFAVTVKNVETTLQKSGFMIVTTVDHQNMLRMVGASLKGAKTIAFGKADMGKMLLPMAPETGLEMPATFYVWERGDGKTVVSYRKPSGAFSTYGNEMVAKMGNDMDGMWAMMVEEATK
jgi:uncharacterized protein (DUF302 family)